MLVLLVFVIVLILLFGGSAVLASALGLLGWILGAIAVLGFSVWMSTTFDMEAGVVILGMLFGVPLGCLILATVGFYFENRRKPKWQQKTYSQFFREAFQSEKKP